MTSNDPNVTAAESAVRQVGTEFRRLRSLRGERIEDIAAYLDIKPTHLFAIEQGDLSVIPSKREAKAMVRGYADYLGLDGETIIGPMDPIIATLEGDKAPPVEAAKPAWIDRTSMIILSASVVLGVMVGWSWIGDVDQFDLIAPPVTADDVDLGSEELGTDQPAPADSALTDEALTEDVLTTSEPNADIDAGDLSEEAAEAADALLTELKTALADEAGPVGGEGESVLQADDEVSSEALLQAGSQTGKEEKPTNVLAALVAERGDGAHIYEAENTDARVIVRALNDVSVQVTSQSRDYVWTRTMKAREMLLVPNREDLELWTGDASGIELLLDGRVLPPLGPPSTVVSGLSLAPSSLEVTSDTLSEDNPRPTF